MKEQREWIEIGKMYANMKGELDVQLIQRGSKFSCLTNIPTYKKVDDFLELEYKVLTCSDDWHPSAYEAIKATYFNEFLGFENTENIQLDLDPATVEILEKRSDEDGVTMDEVILEILSDYIEREGGNLGLHH